MTELNISKKVFYLILKFVSMSNSRLWKLSSSITEYIYIAWVENVNFKNCNFRVLRGIFLGSIKKQKLLKIEKYQARWPFFLIWAFLESTRLKVLELAKLTIHAYSGGGIINVEFNWCSRLGAVMLKINEYCTNRYPKKHTNNISTQSIKQF